MRRERLLRMWSNCCKVRKRVLDRKANKRTIWFHKLMYGNCLRFITKIFFEWLTKAKPTEVIFFKFGASIQVICLDLMGSSGERFFHDNNYQKIRWFFEEYLQILLFNGSLCKFWLSYIWMAEILHKMMRGSREDSSLLNSAFWHNESCKISYNLLQLTMRKRKYSNVTLVSKFSINGQFAQILLDFSGMFLKIVCLQKIVSTVN